jgi:cell division protein ZapA
MGQAQITVNNRHYEVSCGDGEEDRLRELGAALDRRVKRLAQSIGQVGEVRLLLLTCLLLEDEIGEAAARAQPSGGGAPAAVPPPGAGMAEAAAAAEDRLGDDLDRLAQRIEAVADRLRQP